MNIPCECCGVKLDIDKTTISPFGVLCANCYKEIKKVADNKKNEIKKRNKIK